MTNYFNIAKVFVKESRKEWKEKNKDKKDELIKLGAKAEEIEFAFSKRGEQ